MVKRYCRWMIGAAAALLVVSTAVGQPLSDEDWQLVHSAESQRIAAIEQVMGSVVAIYDWDRQGGGSGVIIDPCGLAVTNHHVIMGAGVSGWGGLADGKLYEWDLIGSDPGGDVAVIQLRGRDDFPYARWGDSSSVRVGDWAMAMGNPFVLSEDHAPTITLGIVSGVQRFQPGAGQNQLVYGNCIQIDSSINPGNSGGPLFDRFGQIIGINGRASFLDRGRVNVGLGYAISANQVVQFLPDLLATKLARHGTLDASFGPHSGRIRCTTINEDAPVARAGLSLGDELLEFEGVSIQSTNQFLNLICTLPEGWPAQLKVRKADQSERSIVVRLLGLPYQRPQPPPREDPGDQPDQRQQRQQQLQQEMMALLASEQGRVRQPDINQRYVKWLWQHVDRAVPVRDATQVGIRWRDQIWRGGERVGVCVSTLLADGSWSVEWTEGDATRHFEFDGVRCAMRQGEDWRPLTRSEAKLQPPVNAAWAVAAANGPASREFFGSGTLEGSDKAAGAPAFRLKLTDADHDWYYVWLAGRNPLTDAEHIRVIKVSPDLDGDRAAGAIALESWGDCDGWLLPACRRMVRGLAEQTDWELRLDSWEQVESATHGEAAFDVALPAVKPNEDRLFAEPTARGAAMSRHQQDGTQSAADLSLTNALHDVIVCNQPRLVKVFGAGVGRVEGYASGMIVSPDGLIVTTQGVYLEGGQVRVVTADGHAHAATVLRRDRTVQLALLKIDAATPDYFPLTEQEAGAAGDWVVALSNAFRVADKDEPLSAMLGVIALRTSIDARLTDRDVAYRGDLVLIDAISSNPGAGGGAVVTLDHRLVGVIGKIINSSETNTRLNYAIPTPIVRAFVQGDSAAVTSPAMLEGQADLGIKLFEVGGQRNPAYIDRVTPESPAEAVGLQADDLIVSLAGERIGSIRDYHAALSKLTPGHEVVIVVKRGAELLRLNIIPRVRE